MVALPVADGRAIRAAAEIDRYTFRRVEIKTSRGPITAVYVTAPKGTCYTVWFAPETNEARCNCPDAQHRNLRCKHAYMSLAFLDVAEPRELAPKPAEETPEQRRARFLKDRELWD